MNNLIPVPLKSELKLEVVKTFRDYTLVRPLNRESCNVMGVLMCNCLSGYREALPIYFVMKREKIICAIEVGFKSEPNPNYQNGIVSKEPAKEIPWVDGYNVPVNSVYQIRSIKNNTLAKKHSQGVDSLIRMQYPELEFDIDNFTKPIRESRLAPACDNESPLKRFFRKSWGSLHTISCHFRYIRTMYVREFLEEQFPKYFKAKTPTLINN